eukprot:gene22220-28334_t
MNGTSSGNHSLHTSPMMSGKHSHMTIPTLASAPSDKHFSSLNNSNISDFPTPLDGTPSTSSKSSAKLASISPSVLSSSAKLQPPSQSFPRKGSFSDLAGGGDSTTLGVALALMTGNNSTGGGVNAMRSRGSSVSVEQEREVEVAQTNDRLIQDRLQEAKALSRRDDHGAVMHTFSLWKKPPTNINTNINNNNSSNAIPVSATLVTPTKASMEPVIGEIVSQQQRPLSAGKVLRGPKVAISQLAAGGDSAQPPSTPSGSATLSTIVHSESATKSTTTKEPRSSNKTRLYTSLLSQSVVPSVDTSASIEGPLLSAIIASAGAGDLSTEVEGDEGSVADDDWSAYSSDFESALEGDGDEGGGDQLAVVGIGLQRGLASALRSKVVDAKSRDSRGSRDDVSTLANRMSTSLPVGGFSAAMAAEGGDLDTSRVLSGLDFSRSIDSGSFAKAMAQSEHSVDISEYGTVSSVEHSDAASTSSTLRSQSVQLATFSEDSAAIFRVRSASIGSTVQTTVASKPLTSMTARPANPLVPNASGDTPSKKDPSRGSRRQDARHSEGTTSKYQTLRQLKGSKHTQELVVTSIESNAVTEEYIQRQADCSSPTLSELSDVGEDLVSVRPQRAADQPVDSHTMTPAGKRALSSESGGSSDSGVDGGSDRHRSASPLQWKKGEAIGEGTFGKVFKGLNEKTGELLAIKQLCIADGSEHEVESLQREIRVMWDLDCEFIVRYLGTSRSDRYLFIVLEYVTGGSIAGMLSQFGVFSENLVKRFSLQIVTGVDYLHTKGIIHRDIKGANILVTESGVAKLADFGCSKQLAGMCTASLEESLRAIRGSVPWMAPEVIKQSGSGRASDIWSLGATLIEMTTGKPPWPEFTNNLAALFHVATSKTPPPLPATVSPSCADFIRRCLMIEPGERATAPELLQMPFLSVVIEVKASSNA